MFNASINHSSTCHSWRSRMWGQHSKLFWVWVDTDIPKPKKYIISPASLGSATGPLPGRTCPGCPGDILAWTTSTSSLQCRGVVVLPRACGHRWGCNEAHASLEQYAVPVKSLLMILKSTTGPLDFMAYLSSCWCRIPWYFFKLPFSDGAAYFQNSWSNVLIVWHHVLCCTHRSGACNVCRAGVAFVAGAEPPLGSWMSPPHLAGWAQGWPGKRKQGAVRWNLGSRGQRLKCCHGNSPHCFHCSEHCCCSGPLVEFAVGGKQMLQKEHLHNMQLVFAS